MRFDFFVVKRKEFLDLAKQPLSDAVGITFRPKSYLILGDGSERQPVGALFSCYIITCIHNKVTLSMPSPSSGRLTPSPFFPWIFNWG